MGFKETFEEDLREAFFVKEEFAEEHMIDGEPVAAIISDAGTGRPAEAGRKGSFNPKDLSLQKEKKIIRIMEKDTKRRYAVNSILTVDGEKMFIYETQRMHGTVQLTVGKCRT